MPALNFQKQFAPMVETGQKTQTIRAHRRDGRTICKVGDTLALYTGMRTKGCRKLGEGEVRRVNHIAIETWGLMEIIETQGRATLCPFVAHEVLNEFAQADGFNDWPEMCAWFEKTHGLPFEGVLIEWELIE